jgi:flagellar biosynthetic protein FliR
MPLSLSLADLPIDVFIVFAVFCRVGAMFMTAPAFGDFSLSPRIRLAAALAVTAALAPVMADAYPQWTQNHGLGVMTGIVIGEILFGSFLGLAARAMASALNVAGQIIAFQMGLSLAQIFDPTQELQGAIVGGFLAVLGTTMIFATDLHHVMLAALKDSYVLLSPGALPRIGDMSGLMVETLSSAFSLGLRLSAPFVLFGLVFYVGAGVLNRLMPQAQVFFMLMPANLALGLMLLMLTVGLIMTVYLERFEAFLAQFLA